MIDEDLKRLFSELAESQKRTDEQLAKTDAQLAKTDAQLAKSDAKLSKFIEKVDGLSQMYGGVSNNQGKVAEEFFYNSLKHNPELDGIRFDFIRKNITGSLGKIEEEYDIVLVNGSIVYLIEVKYRLRIEDINRYLSRKVPNFTKVFPEYKDFEIRVGFASFFIEDELIEYAREKGFLLLKRRGKVFEAVAA
jgi:hypothetical protein